MAAQNTAALSNTQLYGAMGIMGEFQMYVCRLKVAVAISELEELIGLLQK